MSQDMLDAIRTFTGQDAAQAFVKANTLIVQLQQENKRLKAENDWLRRLGA